VTQSQSTGTPVVSSTATNGTHRPVRLHSIPPGVVTASEWSWRLVVILASLAAMVWLLSYVWLLVVPLFIAAMVSTLLSPGHQWLTRRMKLPAIASSLLLVATLLVAVVAMIVLTGQQLANGFSRMWESVQTGTQRVIEQLQDWGVPIWSTSLEQLSVGLGETLQDHSEAIVNGAIGFGSGAANIVAGVATAVFAVVFFLKDGRKIWRFALRVVPTTYRRPVHGAGQAGWKSLGAYTRVQILVALVDAIGIGLGAWLLGVPMALPLGVLVFMGSFVPIVGAVVTGAVAVLLALVANGWGIALAMLAVVLVVQQVESNVMQPLVMGRAVNLHPLAVFLSVAAGVAIGGLVGAIFAVPLLAFVNEFVRYLMPPPKPVPDTVAL